MDPLSVRNVARQNNLYFTLNDGGWVSPQELENFCSVNPQIMVSDELRAVGDYYQLIDLAHAMGYSRPDGSRDDFWFQKLALRRPCASRAPVRQGKGCGCGGH